MKYKCFSLLSMCKRILAFFFFFAKPVSYLDMHFPDLLTKKSPWKIVVECVRGVKKLYLKTGYGFPRINKTDN